jgi:DNA-binding IclR family transcriptional regulator
VTSARGDPSPPDLEDAGTRTSAGEPRSGASRGPRRAPSSGGGLSPADPEAFDRTLSQSLARGLAILDLVAASGTGASITDLAAATGLHRTIVSRLVKTLTLHKYLVRDTSGRCQLGGRLWELSRHIQPPLREVAVPLLRRVADETGATAHLTVAEGPQAVALFVVEPTLAAFHVSYRVGMRRSISRGASGLALLASMPPTPDEPPAVELTRKRGWAMSEGELETNATGIAVSVPHKAYGHHSLGVVMLSSPANPEQIARRLKAAAQELAEKLG